MFRSQASLSQSPLGIPRQLLAQAAEVGMCQRRGKPSGLPARLLLAVVPAGVQGVELLLPEGQLAVRGLPTGRGPLGPYIGCDVGFGVGLLGDPASVPLGAGSGFRQRVRPALSPVSRGFRSVSQSARLDGNQTVPERTKTISRKAMYSRRPNAEMTTTMVYSTAKRGCVRLPSLPFRPAIRPPAQATVSRESGVPGRAWRTDADTSRAQ